MPFSLLSTSGLMVKIDGPYTISDVADLKLTSTITNTTGNPITLVNDPSSILTSKHPTERYHVIHSSGVKPIFRGIKIKFSPQTAADLGNVTVLQPDQSFTITHKLSEPHDFKDPGNGQYTFKPKNTFYTVDPTTKEVNLIKADALSSITLYISGFEVVVDDQGFALRDVDENAEKDADKNTEEDADKSAEKEVEIKEIKFENCTDDQKKIISAAANNAMGYISSCKTHLEGLTVNTCTARYKAWFGEYFERRKKTVKSHFEKIGKKLQNVTYDASNTDPDIYAYVYPEDDTKIYLGGAFWNAPGTGPDSQAGTIIHFTSCSGTSDCAYGQRACRKLAKDKPGDAVMNPDSHEYFAEDDPAES
ncbi:hypothetical protein AX15_004537 [Amanita polypyramis BW_CC]|nr:hypothetical protein AX15_004537 [Amanita polypyramis BW_CC]